MIACAETGSSERIELIVDGLLRSGSLRLRLRGLSMLPSLWPGDEVEFAACDAAELQRGEVVLAVRDERIFVHRVVKVGESAYVITRGDAMPGPDAAFPPQAVVGKAIRVLRGGRSFPVSQQVTLLRRMFGLLLCYSSLARRVGLRVHGLCVEDQQNLPTKTRRAASLQS